MRQDYPPPLQPLKEAPPDRARLVVFSDDWGRHPSSAQHLIRHLLPHFRVDWVNTIGTHRPRLSLTDLRRGVEKLKGWVAPRQSEPTAKDVLAPTVHAPAARLAATTPLSNVLVSPVTLAVPLAGLPESVTLAYTR